MEYESVILKRLIDTYGVVGNPRYISEIIKEFIVQGKERFPELFTYQADWLAHIDEFGLNPSYTVSYTGQSIYAPNTLEKPVKSAILKGNTLVNLVRNGNSFLTLSSSQQNFTLNLSYNLEKNKQYLIVGETTQNEATVQGVCLFIKRKALGNKYFSKLQMGVGIFSYILTTDDEITELSFYIHSDDRDNGKTLTLGKAMVLEYQEGMENWDIPYFEGMQSVKMPVLTTTGKNLFDEVWESGSFNGTTGAEISDSNTVRSKNYISVEPNKTYTFDVNAVKVYYDREYNVISVDTATSNTKRTITVPSNCHYIRIRMSYNDYASNNLTKQFEKGSISTSYEPFKSNILSCLEPVELGSVGEVKDELNLLTQQLTQRTETRAYQEGDESNSEVLTDMTNTRYKLPKEAIKTVDLTILDQNGQNVKQLMSFNGGTHFNTGSLEGSPLPSVAVTVETDLEETLRVCSLDGNTM